MKYSSYILFLIFILFSNCSIDSSTDTVDPTDTIDETLAKLHSPVPRHNSIVQTTSVDLSWSAEGEPLTYLVRFGKSFMAMDTLAVNYKTNIINVPRLIEKQTYYWQVFANYSDDTIDTSAIWDFTINNLYPDGYTLVKHDITTIVPDTVQINFQVFNLNDDGISGMKVNDFLYYEDGEPIHERESDTLILRATPFPYELNTVLMIDNSTSVENPNELNELKKGATDLISSGILTGQTVTIYSFSEYIIKMLQNNSDQGVVLGTINTITEGAASTDLYGAVIEGTKILEDEMSINKAKQSILIIFTDGKDTQQRHTLNEAIYAATDKKIIFVSLTDADEIDLSIMRVLGSEGFYYYTAMDLLAEHLKGYQTKLDAFVNSFYEMKYTSPIRGASVHSFLITIIKNNYTGVGSSLTAEYNTKDFY